MRRNYTACSPRNCKAVSSDPGTSLYQKKMVAATRESSILTFGVVDSKVTPGGHSVSDITLRLRAFVKRFAVTAALVAGVSTLTPAQEVKVVAPHQHAPASVLGKRADGAWTSTNWSGYAVTGSNAQSVSASWIVPASTCSHGPAEFSSFWVGIDGWSSGTVEQVGTDSDCSSGRPVYYAWYEFYPQPSYYAGTLTNLHPGDQITATVTYSGNVFTATIKDVTSGGSYTTTFTPSTPASRSSVEWIAEAPSSGKKILSLADFGTVAFTNCQATIEVAGAKNASSGDIGSFLPGNTSVANSANVQVSTMVSDGKTSVPMATPSGLTSGGSGFSVTWDSTGP